MTMIFNGTTGITFPDGQTQDVGVPDPGTNGNVLTSNGTIWTSAAPGTYSQWTTSGSNIFYNTGNVGIGTSTIGSGLSFGSRYVGNNGYANAIRLYDEGAASTSTTSNSYGFGFISDGILSYTAGTGGQHAWFTANTERMRIDSSGNVGIGTSVPNAKMTLVQASEIYGFTIQGNSTSQAGSIRFTNAGFTAEQALLQSINGGGLILSTAGSERMRIDSSGNVMIGTTTARGRLHSTASSFNPISGNVWASSASFTASGAFGGGLTLVDGTAGYGLWVQDAGGTFAIGQGSISGNLTERMRIDSNGNVGIGTSSPSFPLDVAGAIRGNSWIARANTSVPSADAAIYRPADNTLGFSTANTERMRITSAGNVQLSTGGTSILNSSGRAILNQTGSILQVLSTTKTDTFTTTSTSFTDITGLSVTITPSSTSSRIAVFCDTTITAGGGPGGFYGVRLMRDATPINVGAAAGSRTRASYGSITQSDDNMTKTGAFNFVDSPATTSATTYKLQAFVYSGGTICINRQFTDSDTTGFGRFASTITVMEIAG